MCVRFFRFSKKTLEIPGTFFNLGFARFFSNNDLIEGVKVLLSGRLTMSEITKKFELQFAKYVGSKHALMVNSGSSANLLALFAATNPSKKNKLEKGDECLMCLFSGSFREKVCGSLRLV